VLSVNVLIIVPSPLRGRARERVKIEATLSPTLSHLRERRVFR
jgi:hypothetical protein